MAWQTPKTDWVTNPENPKPEDFNRIEGNIEFLKNDVEAKKDLIATALSDMNQPAQITDTYLELATKIRNISKDATAAVGDVEKGKTFYAGGSKKTGTLELTGNAAVGDVEKGKTFYNTDLKTKQTGTLELTGNAVAGDVEKGKTFYNTNLKTKVTGTLELTGNAAVGDVEKGKTFYNTNLKIKQTGTLELTGNAAVGDVLSGKTFYNTDLKTKRTGTMPNKGATNITISEFATTIPAGYYNGSGKVVMPLVAGDEIELYRSGSFTVHYSSSGSNWTKVCELTMHAAGSVRISFDLRGALQDIGNYYKGPGYGRIYKNGSPAGIERVVYSDKTTRFTEDFNVQNDDKVQLYLRTTTASSYVSAGDLTVSIQIPFDKTSVVERTY